MDSPRICPRCGAAGSGNFCSVCGTSLSRRECSVCGAALSAQARFCHRCGRPAASDAQRSSPGSDRTAWLVAGTLCLLLVGGIAYRVWSSAPRPVAPDMANAGVETGEPALPPSSRAPDISSMSPRERFDRLFNRIMQAAERGDSGEVTRFTPMALGAYQQLETRDIDARYHAAVLQLGVGNLAPAYALADTVLRESPGHLFGYLIRGTGARLQGDSAAELRAQREFLGRYRAEMAANRPEYREHRPVIEEFKLEAERAEKAPR